MTRAEAVALALLSALATAVMLPHVTDAIGFGVAPRVTAIMSSIVGTAIAVTARWSIPAPTDAALFVATVVVTLTVAGWMAWPNFLPPGSGPDLTHHLLLVDYIERHGTLVHDPNAAAAIGEMAHYTPGVHLLAVIAGAVFRSNGFAAIYPVVAFSVALKFGLVALCLLRLFAVMRARLILAIGGIGLAFYAAEYSLGSFIHDSFLAQAVAELFAVAMWWALIVWDQKPSIWSMVAFAWCGMAAFLTWPVWVGPPVIALAILLVFRRDLLLKQRIQHLVTAVMPIAVIAALHTIGRTQALSLVGTSGAVSLPALSLLGWWLPTLAVIGLVLSPRTPPFRALLAFVIALGLQTAALWLVAQQSGATTPYMAIKMRYLAVYPLTAAAMIAIARVRTKPLWAVLAVAAILAAASRHVAGIPKSIPIVSHDLWSAGIWARENVRPACVDYLVSNEYTAYWLHLAVLGNPRASARSADNNTYLTQPSFARWLVDDEGPPYAIARWSVLPVEIRDRVKVLYRAGDAAVISRPTSCRGQGE